MVFENRNEAALLLAKRLEPRRSEHPLVLGVPRGGVPIAKVIADALGAELLLSFIAPSQSLHVEQVVDSERFGAFRRHGSRLT